MDDIGQLVRLAGERETVDPARFENARARVGEHWQTVVATTRRSNRARLGRWAMAASVLLAVGIALVLLHRPDRPAAVQIATVDHSVGGVLIDGKPAHFGDQFFVNSVVGTSTGGRVALSMSGGQSVRIDESSRLLFTAPGRLELDAGGVYIDTGPTPDKPPLAVVTPFGVATDVGTQFQVRFDDGLLQIGVREGLVELARNDNIVIPVDDGSLLKMSLTGEISTAPLASDDSLWHWVAAIPSEFNIEGALLTDYLAWYARESGLSLAWDTPASRAAATQTRLSGSISNLTLNEGFELVQRIARFDTRIVDSTLYIRID